MNIHKIITKKGYIQECDNIVNESVHHIKKPLSEIQRPFYALTTFVLQGIDKFHHQQHSGTQYCHDCSLEHHKPVYHSFDESFTDYINQPVIRRYSAQLNEISELLTA